MTTWQAIGAGCLACAIAACGDDPGNVVAGLGGVGGAGEVSEVCGLLCVSPCTANLAGLPNDPEECLDECASTPVYEACATPTIAFVSCLQESGCGQQAAKDCQSQSIEFGQCLTLPGE
ncbi:MAG: hypothetical protein WBG86_04700 [Polyangiales bacterium]